jgi:hypothetical protein
VIIVTADFHDTELREVFVDELRIQQLVPLPPQPRHKVDERDLAGIGCGRKHALTEKRAAYRNTVDAAHQLFAAPRFDAMRKTCFMQLRIQIDDFIVDPCIGTRIGTAGHDGAKGAIECDAVRGLPYRAAQPRRHVQFIDGEDAARRRVVPFNGPRPSAARHREHANRIGMQKQFGRNVRVTLGQGFSQV